MKFFVLYGLVVGFIVLVWLFIFIGVLKTMFSKNKNITKAQNNVSETKKSNLNNKKCKYCGKALKDEESNCPRCGAPVDKE